VVAAGVWIVSPTTGLLLGAGLSVAATCRPLGGSGTTPAGPAGRPADLVDTLDEAEELWLNAPTPRRPSHPRRRPGAGRVVLRDPRPFLADPSALVLDEPTAHLDADTAAALHDL
jgi:alpha-D-ribose 1-methylphosphonate 5-triphosphate synthase subunit PhnL